MHCLASSASAVCAVEKPTRLRAPVTFPGRLCILRFGFHQKETFYSVRLAECFSAGVSQRTNGKLPVWTVWCECAHTFPSPTRSWLTLKLLKANPGAKLGWCVRKWANPTGPGVGGDSKTGFLSRDVSSSSIGGFPAELSGSRLPHLQCPADLSIPFPYARASLCLLLRHPTHLAASQSLVAGFRVYKQVSSWTQAL